MLTLRSTGIALAILCSLFLFGMVNNSNAFEITSLSVSNGASGCYASLTADEDIICINWFVNDTFHQKSEHGNGTREVYLNLGYFPGDIKGKKYKITAEAWLDPDVCMPAPPKSDTFKAYKGIQLRKTGPKTGAMGYVEISSFYYDGSHMIMSSYAYANNPTDNPKAKNPEENTLRVEPWFRTNKFESRNGNERHPEYRDTKKPEDVEVGECSQYFYPGPNKDGGGRFDREVGKLTKKDEPLYFLAHAHLRLSTPGAKIDDLEVDTGVQEFTYQDAPLP